MAQETSGSIMSNEEAAARFTWIIIVLLVIGIIFSTLAGFIARLQGISLIVWILSYIEPFLIYLYFLAFIISSASVVMIVYCRHHIERIMKEEREKLYPKIEEKEYVFGMEETLKNPRWERIETLVSTENPGDWRVAILEADIMLEELLEAMGYKGEGIGERLKQIEVSDFNTLDKAWEAHKIRNQIAHEGADFNLTEREARRVIDLFRAVFDEFEYI